MIPSNLCQSRSKKNQNVKYMCTRKLAQERFLHKGYSVTATDGSAELCRLASAYTGIDVKKMLFQDLDDVDRYDAIWACSSILHLPKTELFGVLLKMSDVLKDAGIIYTSFRYGDFEGERRGEEKWINLLLRKMNIQ